MRRGLSGILMIQLALAPLGAQRIENETASRERVVRVQTALKHLTVIEVAEPVTTVAVGSPEAFKIERRENKVFIQPLEENVATNLFIWTASTRLNYELMPAISDAGRMDFAIDYRAPQQQAQISPSKSSEPRAVVSSLPIPSEMLLNGVPVRIAGRSSSREILGLVLRDVYRKQDEVFVRYSIENRSNKTLRTGFCTCDDGGSLIPPFDAEMGALPPGDHQATLAEIVKRLGFTPRRRWLLKGLRAAVEAFWKAGIEEIYVDGSFCTEKPDPGDIDGYWVEPDPDVYERIDPYWMFYTRACAAGPEMEMADVGDHGVESFIHPTMQATPDEGFPESFRHDLEGRGRGVIQVTRSS